MAVGIWLGHERHGFKYGDPAQVAEQKERARQAILRYKDHPAVLLWGIGNEMEGYEKGDNPAVWKAVNDIAALAKQLDPNHPTMTVVAEIGGERVKSIHALCPDIDIVGINTYAGAASVGQRYKAAGGVKPYVITEFGPPGSWEMNKNAWGVVPEPSSTEKAAFYRRGWEQSVVAQKGLSLGAYAFTWGNKQEATATWFGMLLPDGSRLAAVDTMTELWSGKPPANRVPRVNGLKLRGADQVDPGATVQAVLDAADPDGDPLQVQWVLQREPKALGVGGDAEEVPPTYPAAIVKAGPGQAEIKMPAGVGGYRLFAYVRDNKGGAAVANVPLLAKGAVVLGPGAKAPLPLAVYDEAGREKPAYFPTGWMGNAKAIKMDERSTVKPHGGKTCLRFDYQDKGEWGGVVWQDPANDWGDQPGGWDLSGATHLTFWARGDKGGETVTFLFGLLGSDKTYPDTAQGKLADVKLSDAWQQFRIPLAGKDLTRVKTGFAWTVAGSGRPITFFLDDIRYE